MLASVPSSQYRHRFPQENIEQVRNSRPEKQQTERSNPHGNVFGRDQP